MVKASEMIKRDAVNVFLLCFLAIFFLATWKYVKDGDVYYFQTPASDNYISLTDNVVSQEIVIDEIADWSDRSYAIFFHFDGQMNQNEKVSIALSEEDSIVRSFNVPIGWINEGFNALKWLDFSSLDAGRYELRIDGTSCQNLCVGTCENVYNLPNCYANGSDMGCTLAQIYHFNYANGPYWGGVFLFVALIGMSIIAFWQCVARGEAASGVLRGVLIATYIILAYEYDNGPFYQPLLGEAVTNFMHNSITQSWWKCLPITDAGYLPLVQRLISVFTFNFLNISPYVGLYVLQISAYVLTGIVISFFAKRQFSSVLDIRFRWIFSIILMMTLLKSETHYQTMFFINFIVFGVYIFFLYFLADSRGWSKYEFAIICVWVFAQCLSKGVNVTLLPFCILCMILFRRSYSKRDKIMLSSCALGALLQLVYYVAYGSQSSKWVDRALSSDVEFYHLKCMISVLIDTPNWMLSVLSDKITLLNGIALPIIISFWAVVIYFFAKDVVVRLWHREAVQKETCVFFMAVIFIMAQTLFLRITVLGVNRASIISDSFWSFQNVGNLDDRHTVHVYLAVMLAYIVALSKIARRWSPNKNLVIWSAITLLICVVNPRLQLRGVGNDDYSKNSSITALNNSEAILMKGMTEAGCRIVPMQFTGWRYSWHAMAYCFGEDVLKWTGSTLPTDEPKSGELNLGDFSNVNDNVPIYQVFACKNCLVGANKWKIILYDDHGNILLQQEQDNTEYQKIVSFTFDREIANVNRIQIVDDEFKPVFMENALYLVTKEGEPLLK